MKQSIVLTTFSVLATSLTGQTARASAPCECSEDVVRGADLSISRVAPRILQRNKHLLRVPVNLEWRTHEPPDPTLVFEPMEGGDAIGLTTEMGEAGVLIVRPARALSPSTVYMFAGAEFVTSAEVDTMPPEMNGVVIEGVTYPGACPSAAAAGVELSSMTDDTTMESMVVYRVVVHGEDSDQIIYLPPRAQAGVPAGRDDLTPTFGACDSFCPNNFPDAKLGEDFTATVSVFDLAGNESARHGPITFRFAKTTSALFTCSADGADALEGRPLWFFALMLLAVGSRRRRD